MSQKYFLTRRGLMKQTALEKVEAIISKSEDIIASMEESGKAPNDKKILERVFSVKEASDLVGRARSSLHRAEKDGALDSVRKTTDHTKESRGYSLEEINAFRKHFDTFPWRKAGEKCVKVAIQSFKGGVSKSVTSVHFAQYLATNGYRVLLVDCDPQASATSTFGYLPDKVFTEKDTLLPCFAGDQPDLQYAIIETYYPGVSLIPCCLQFYDAEFQMAIAAANSAEESGNGSGESQAYFFLLDEALKSIEQYYDVIVIDSPPALGMITINILAAADAVIVPTPPAMYDFSSTLQYFKMVRKVMRSIDPSKIYDFIKILASRVDTRKSMSVEFLDIMRDIYGKDILNSVFFQTAEVENCSAVFKTVYDMQKPQTRALNILNAIFGEIELEIRKLWPSHSKQLSNMGVVA